MAYAPDWERLADALKRVAATADEREAKVDLCNALGDRKIKVRVRVSEAEPSQGGEIFGVGNVGVPPHLSPDDFDWGLSRPLKPWWVGPKPGQHYYWTGKELRLDFIELWRADVTTIFCVEEISSKYGQERKEMARTPLPPAEVPVEARRRGAKSKFDWEDIELFVFKALDERGDFTEPRQADNWNTQSDLEKCVAHYIFDLTGKGPAESTIREHICPMVAKWRLAQNQKAGKGR